MSHPVRHAARKLVRAPAFTAAAVLTLALGIGANTAIFSVLRGVLLRPLPFPEAERLVRIYQASPKTGLARGAASTLDFEDWMRRSTAIGGGGAWWFVEGSSGVDLTGLGAPERVSTAFVTGGFFPTLGRSARLGRTFGPEADRGESRQVVLSDGYWRRRFGGDRAVVGRTLTLNGAPFTVVGVMPDDFRFPSPAADVWVPLATIPESAIPRLRMVHFVAVVGRLRPEATVARAQEDLDRIARQLAAEYPQSNAGWDATTVVPLREAVVGDVRPALVVLAAAVGLVLLIACANVANLQLARALGRSREIAVRLALGASQRRIVGELLTESVLLAAAGGALGVLLAAWGVDGLLRLAGDDLPRSADVRTDGTVLAFALAVTALTGILFGLLPARRAARFDLQEALREGGRTGTDGGARGGMRAALVVGQVALAMVLATGAGLMTRSLWRLLDTDPGFDPRNVLAVRFTIAADRYANREAWLAYYRDVLARVAALPGVEAVGGSTKIPPDGANEDIAFVPEGADARVAGDLPRIPVNMIGGDYFRAMRIPLKAGRTFGPEEARGGPQEAEPTPMRVVVNEAFAREYLRGGQAVGRRIQLGGVHDIEVIGVVGDIRGNGLGEPPRPTIYVSVFQLSRVGVHLVVRGSTDPLRLVGPVRAAIWAADPAQSITSVSTLESRVSDSIARPRLFTTLLAIFGATGLALGALGIYGVISYLVTQRLREIGIRLALGASPREVLRLVVGRGLALAAAGVALGLLGALALSRAMTSMLYEVTPLDLPTYAGVALLLVAVAVLASWLPARRAARVEPLVVLRSE